MPETGSRGLRLDDLLRALLVGVIILVGGFYLGQFTFNEIHGRGTPYFVLAAGLGILLTALAYYRIEWVMLAYIAVVWVAVGSTPDVVTGVSSGTGKALALTQIGMTFLLFIWVLRGATRQHFPFARLSLNVLLLLFLAVNVWSAVNGVLFWDPTVARFYTELGDRTGGRTPLLVNVFEVFIRFLSIGAFWLFANNLRTETWVRRASWALLLPGAVIFAIHFIHVPLPLNAYSVLLEIVVACTLFAWLLEPQPAGAAPSRGLRLLGWATLAVLVFQKFYWNIRWISGWFGLFVGLYFVAFLRSRRLFVGLLFAGLCLYLSGQAFLQQEVVHKVQTSGDTWRFAMARAAVMYATKFPLGIGPGNYRQYNLYYGSSSVWGTSTFPSAHGFYSQMLSELGFVGLILTVLFIITALVMVSRFYRRMPAGPSRTFTLGIAGMWAGICATSGIGDYLIPVYHNGAMSTMATTVYAWIGLGIAVAHARFHGLVTEEKPKPVAASLPNAAQYYPRKMGREPS